MAAGRTGKSAPVRRNHAGTRNGICRQRRVLPQTLTSTEFGDPRQRGASCAARVPPDPRRPCRSPMTWKASGRLQLADWIASADNPLTARVIVNRVWHHHFRSRPSWPRRATSESVVSSQRIPSCSISLRAILIDHHWSLKSLHRLILTSEDVATGKLLTSTQRCHAIDPGQSVSLARQPSTPGR